MGTREEYKLEMDREYKERKEKNPDYTQSVKVIDVVIKSPGSKERKKQPKNNITETDSDTAVFTNSINSKIKNIYADQNFDSQEAFKTDAEYLTSLSRATLIFSSQPDTVNFDELLALLPLIKKFEDSQLRFPNVQAFEITKAKMDVVNLPSDYLSAIVGNKEKVELFLSGKLELSVKKIERIFKRLHINLPVNN